MVLHRLSILLLHQRRAVIQQVDQLDPDERNDEPSQAIDQQVAPQERGRAKGRNRTPRKASGISATMISALKMTALRIALCGEPKPHDVEGRDHGEQPRPAWPG